MKAHKFFSDYSKLWSCENDKWQKNTTLCRNIRPNFLAISICLHGIYTRTNSPYFRRISFIMINTMQHINAAMYVDFASLVAVDVHIVFWIWLWQNYVSESLENRSIRIWFAELNSNPPSLIPTQYVSASYYMIYITDIWIGRLLLHSWKCQQLTRSLFD